MNLLQKDFLQGRRNQAAAEAFLCRLLEGQQAEPRMIVTDRLASYRPAVAKVFPRAAHRRHKGINACSGDLKRRRARSRWRVGWCEFSALLQRFLEPFGLIRQHFCPGRHRLPAARYRAILAERRAGWDELAGVAA